MLTHLTVSNLAIIDRLELELAPGFIVLTGETGAGKSIIVDAVSLLLGGRGGTEMIRSGAEKAVVEGVFTLEPKIFQETVAPLLASQGLEGEDATLIVSREIAKSGRSLARLNGHLVPVSVLKEIGQRLVDIHNQGDHLSLLRVKEHLDFLDRYAGLHSKRQELAERVERLYAVRRELGQLKADERELTSRMDLLAHQIQEIAAANLRIGEEEELKQEHNLLANAQRLIAEVNAAYAALHGSDQEEKGALDLLAEASRNLKALEKIDPRLKGERAALEEAETRLSDLVRSLRQYRDKIDYSPGRLAQVEERIGLIYDLKRKYGDTIAEILAYKEKAEKELEGITHRTERIAELEAEEKRLLVTIGQMAGELSKARKEVAKKLAKAIEAELAHLQMQKARFQVQIEHQLAEDGVEIDGQRLAFDATGVDRVEFLVSPNLGEPLKPLAKIASGGETARLMLALKTVLVSADRTPTLIFDEIDAGLGARAGETVGRKLWSLTRGHQVLCVTHLPQIAAFADAHFRVSKEESKGRTVTRVEGLDQKGRLAELAQMFGVKTIGVQESVRELYRRSQELKKARG